MTPNSGEVQSLRSPTKEEERENLVPIIKEFRQSIDALIQRVPLHYNIDRKGDEIMTHALEAKEPRDQVRVHLINAKMWAGKILEALDNPFPKELADRAER